MLLFFCSSRIRILVAMATYSSYRLIMEKVEIDKFLLSHWRYLNREGRGRVGLVVG